MKSVSHCLIASIFEPPMLALDERKEYAVGRDAGADIFLPSRQVSRRHAKLSWASDEQGFVIRDVWSRRGFKVNGKQTERQRLRDDDEIAIEPYRLRYRIYEGDVAPLLARAGGPPARDWRLAGRARGSELLAIIGQVDIADLTVAAKIENEAHSGTLVIAGGRLVSAEAAYLRGGRAAHALLMGESCRFELRAIPAPTETAPAISLAQLLSEILARMGADFVTTMDTTEVHEDDILQLEKRLQAAAVERELRAVAGRGRMLEADVRRAEELQQAMQRPLPRDARLEFERRTRPAASLVAGVHAVTPHPPGRFRVVIAEPVGATGIDGLLRAMVIKAEAELADSPDLQAADVLNLLHRRLGERPERILCRASVLDVDAKAMTLACDGAPQLLHVHDGVAILPIAEPPPATDSGVGPWLPRVQIAAQSGDRVLLLSAALSGQRDRAGNELGLSRLAACATRTARLELGAALDALIAEADAFRDGVPQDGDYILFGIDAR
jgi:hypothetical protein